MSQPTAYHFIGKSVVSFTTWPTAYHLIGKSVWWSLCEDQQPIISNLVRLCSLSSKVWSTSDAVFQNHHDYRDRIIETLPSDLHTGHIFHVVGSSLIDGSFESLEIELYFASLALKKITSQSFMTKLICSSPPPHCLSLGFIITDNIVRAVWNGQFTHVPRFAHCLNLLEHDFPKNDGSNKDLLAEACKICTHFSHSVMAHKILWELQEKNNVQTHA